jgi:Tfp pilus assembly protein PilO
MSLNARDKKILIVLVPVMLVAAYWFLVLVPKREEAANLGEKLAAAESRRDAAEEALRQAEASKGDYAKDYATVVRLGKAIPSDVDMPSLLVQLDRAAKGTNIRFAKIAAGPRTPPPVAPVAAPAEGSSEPPAADAGGAAATTGPGQATESANETAAEANSSSDASAAAAGSPPPAAGTPPVAGAPAAGTPAAGTTTPTAAPTALDTVPLTFSFDGRFGDLADFFHEMKRFVRVANDRVQVDGRLMKINGFTFDSAEFPTVTAEVTATVYLAPKTEGATAGATPDGPAPTTTTTPAPAAAAPAPAPATPVAQGAAQ